jgi:TPR repeat protein
MQSSTNQNSVSGAPANANGRGPVAAGPVAAGSDVPLVGTWSHAAPWNDASVGSRRLSIMAGVALGFLGILAVAGALARNLGATSCATGAECSQLGVRYAQGAEGIQEDDALAARLFQRGCELGSAAACNNLGLAFESGEGVPQDYERSMEFFGRACSGGFAEACNNQGALYEHGRGVPVNLGDAQRLYTQACRHGSGLGCSNLGVLYAQGRGVAVDREEAARLFRAACTAGSSVGCNNLVDSDQMLPTAN